MLKWSILTIGGITAALNCYGAYEQAIKTDGGYLTIAAPVVVLCLALIPYFAERVLKAKHWLKGLIWCLVLLPVGAYTFFAMAERTHYAKAGAEAERVAQRAAVTRAEQSLADARAQLASAEFDVRAASKLPQKPASKNAKVGSWCDEACGKRRNDVADKARKVRDEALADVTKLQGQATEESAYVAPVWLLPASLDLVTFVAVWTGLAMPGKKAPVKVKRRRRRKVTPPQPKLPVRLKVVA